MKSARIDARPTVGQFSLIGARRSKGIVNEESIPAAAVMADRSESFPAAQGAKHPHKYLHLQERSALPGRVRPLACLTVGPRRVILLQWHSRERGDHDRSRPRGRSAAHARRARARGVAFRVHSTATEARPRAVPPPSQAEKCGNRTLVVRARRRARAVGWPSLARPR